VEHSYDKDVQEFAEKIHSRLLETGLLLNIPNVVIDICYEETEISDHKKNLRLVEINMFETASFYACDLDNIYGAWAEQVQKSND
jgi:hypothetical protein